MRTDMRQNGDERLRELERATLAGDTQAAIQLLREETRAGRERDHYDDAKYLVDTPLGQVSFSIQNERTIYVQIGERDVEIGTGSRYGRKKVTLAPVTINNVPCFGNVHYHFYDEELVKALTRNTKPEHWSIWMKDLRAYVPGFAPYSVSARERNGQSMIDVSPGLYLKRDDRRAARNDEASDSAKKRLLAVLTPIVNQWAATHKREMLEAEAGSVNNKIMSHMEAYKEALDTLDQIEKALAGHVVREVQVQAELK